MVTRKIEHKQADGTVLEADIGALAGNIVEDTMHRFVTDEEKNAFLKSWFKPISDGDDFDDLTEPGIYYYVAPMVAENTLMNAPNSGNPRGPAIIFVTKIREYEGHPADIRQTIFDVDASNYGTDSKWSSYTYSCREYISNTATWTEWITESVATSADLDELKKSVSDGKTLVAAAITEKKVTTSATATFATMATNIRNILAGTGNAMAADVLAGKTFSNSDGANTGSMPNHAGKSMPTNSITAAIQDVGTDIWETSSGKGSNLGIKLNFHGYVDENTIVNQNVYGLHPDIIKAGELIGGNGSPEGGATRGKYTADANAAAADILTGKTAYVNGKKITGTIENHTGTPTKINYWRIQNNRFEVAVPKGFYWCSWDGNSYEYMELANVASCIGLTAAKLLNGQTVCGVAGSATGDATAIAANILKDKTAYVNGAKVTGTLAVNSALSFSIAAVSATEVEIYWTNPAKGPFSGVFVQMSTSGYPGTAGTRVYTGMGTNSAAGGKSSCRITGLTPETKYYFTAFSYCTGLGNGEPVHLTVTTPKPKGMKIFTASGTFTVPAGVTSVDIFAVGGGGGGGTLRRSDDRRSIIGGGGGGGTDAVSPVAVTPGESLSIVVGAGGCCYNDSSIDGLPYETPGGYSKVTRGSTNLAYAPGGHGGVRISETPIGGDGGSGGGAGGGDKNGTDYSGRGYAGAGGSNGSNGGEGVLSEELEGEDNEYKYRHAGGEGQGRSTKAFGDGTLYAGGGSGCLLRAQSPLSGSYVPVAGGAGGGGAGGLKIVVGSGSVVAMSGTANTGGGGGGVWNEDTAGKGGSGVVIIRWGYE